MKYWILAGLALAGGGACGERTRIVHAPAAAIAAAAKGGKAPGRLVDAHGGEWTFACRERSDGRDGDEMRFLLKSTEGLVGFCGGEGADPQPEVAVCPGTEPLMLPMTSGGRDDCFLRPGEILMHPLFAGAGRPCRGVVGFTVPRDGVYSLTLRARSLNARRWATSLRTDLSLVLEGHCLLRRELVRPGDERTYAAMPPFTLTNLRLKKGQRIDLVVGPGVNETDRMGYQGDGVAVTYEIAEGEVAGKQVREPKDLFLPDGYKGGLTPRLTFSYGGDAIDSTERRKTVREADGRRYESFTLTGGVEVTTEIVRHGDAWEWVSWFENKGKEKSPRIAGLNDADFSFALPRDEYHASAAFTADGVQTVVYSHQGSTWDDGEYAADVFSISEANVRRAALPNAPPRGSAREKRFRPVGGRSSDGAFPFFNVNRGDEGLIVAVGWTGQWTCFFGREPDGTVNVRTGIEGVDFSLDPGERIRTSSIVALPYKKGYVAAQNAFRRLVKEHYSSIGRPGRPAHAPYSFMLWGGVTSEELVKRINFAGRERLGFDCAWVDAGWYGRFTTPSPNEFVGAWWNEAGDWRVNTLFHKDDFADVARAASDNGFRFLLWLEIERAADKAAVRKEHPDWFHGQLLDLGNAAAWQWAHDTLAGLIRRLNIGCYRQDFNMQPLGAWRSGDAPDRKGLTEIHHIMGLYRLWDTLLEEFPHLIIDNCASGGRRIDIETLRRSVPLWRSDYNCPPNADPDVTQNHTLGLARWVPYNGTSYGQIPGDTYRARSSYTTGFGGGLIYSMANDPAALTKEQLDWQRRISAEYLRVRELMEEDFYPLTAMAARVDKSGWCAWQFHDPVRNKGLVMAFRRELSPCREAEFPLGGLAGDRSYTFTDADTGAKETHAAAELRDAGLRVTIPTRRAARLLFYE